MDFLKDNRIDNVIKDIIDIFSLEGVELVRLSGMTSRARKVSNMDDISIETIDNIIKKLKNNNIINYEYITYCPHCQEVSYQIKPLEKNSKMCDSCKILYSLIDNYTLLR